MKTRLSFYRWKLFPLLVGIAVLTGAILACGGSSDANTGTKAGTAPTQAAQAPTQAPATKFKQGDAVKVGDTWQVTVNSIKTYTSDNEYEQPKDGNQFVVINVTLKNVSSKEQESNYYNFSLRGGANGSKYDIAAVDAINNTPSGKVEPGDQLSGDLPYEVKADEKTFILGFEADSFSSGQTQWELSL